MKNTQNTNSIVSPSTAALLRALPDCSQHKVLSKPCQSIQQQQQQQNTKEHSHSLLFTSGRSRAFAAHWRESRSRRTSAAAARRARRGADFVEQIVRCCVLRAFQRKHHLIQTPQTSSSSSSSSRRSRFALRVRGGNRSVQSVQQIVQIVNL